MFRGCDPEALREAAAALLDHARRIRELARALAAAAQGVAWEGPDGDEHRADVQELTAGLLTELAEAFTDRARVLEAEATAQDEASAPDQRDPAAPTGAAGGPAAPGGAAPASADLSAVAETLRALGTVEEPQPLPAGEQPSRGLFTDALGPELGPEATRAWTEYAAGGTLSGAVPVAGVSEALAADSVNAHAGRYEMIQGLREGDPFKVTDGFITAKLAEIDAAANILELTPALPIAAPVSVITGEVSAQWHGLRLRALDREAEGGGGAGSPSRLVYSLPRTVDAELVQPVADAIGGRVGGMIGTGGSVMSLQNQVSEDRIDAGGRRLSATAQEQVPGLREVLGAPRRAVELPRRALEGTA